MCDSGGVNQPSEVVVPGCDSQGAYEGATDQIWRNVIVCNVPVLLSLMDNYTHCCSPEVIDLHAAEQRGHLLDKGVS